MEKCMSTQSPPKVVKEELKDQYGSITKQVVQLISQKCSKKSKLECLSYYATVASIFWSNEEQKKHYTNKESNPNSHCGEYIFNDFRTLFNKLNLIPTESLESKQKITSKRRKHTKLILKELVDNNLIDIGILKNGKISVYLPYNARLVLTFKKVNNIHYTHQPYFNDFFTNKPLKYIRCEFDSAKVEKWYKIEEEVDYEDTDNMLQEFPEDEEIEKCQ